MAAIDRKHLWRYVRGLAAPVLLWVFGFLALREPLRAWLRADDTYDQQAMHEWINEAVVSRLPLPELVAKCQRVSAAYGRSAQANGGHGDSELLREVSNLRQTVLNQLVALGTPPTKMYPGQLPLFPVIYRLEVRFNPTPDALAWMNEPIVWESDLPRGEGQYTEKSYALSPDATVMLQYQLHAYDKRQHDEQHAAQRTRWVLALAVAGT
ncbi:MAG TPA: hypothetical protein VKE94_02215, partial [Gemmataceae bacterium]|nr:hypothetical protein [Gemmataceae bacterium]